MLVKHNRHLAPILQYVMLESFQFQMALISDTKDDVRRQVAG